MNKYCNLAGVGLILVRSSPTDDEMVDADGIQWGPFASGRLACRPSQEPVSIRASVSANGFLYASGNRNTDRVISRIEEIAGSGIGR